VGEVFWGVPEPVVRAIQSSMGYSVAIETGTYEGASTAVLASMFPEVVTIERDPDVLRRAEVPLAAHGNVTVVHGDSGACLAEVLADVDQPALFWLDAHWFGSVPGEEAPQCPLLAELSAIRSWPFARASTVIVDDARMFCTAWEAPLRRTDWPRFLDVVDHLRMAPDTYVTLLQDCFFAGPPELERLIDGYWLTLRRGG